MKIEAHLKGNSTYLYVPPERNIKWLIEAVQLWAQEAKGLAPRLGKCEARRAGGEVLNPEKKLGHLLREGESVYIFLEEDIKFINMGR